MSDDDLNSLDRQLRGARQATRLTPAQRHQTDVEAQNVNNGARAGMELVTSILAGVAIGWALDNWLHTKPWCLLVFGFLGIGAGFYSVWRISTGLTVKAGSPALQSAEKNGTKPPEINDDDDQ